MELKIQLLTNYLESCGNIACFLFFFYLVDQMVVFISFFIYTFRYRTHPMSLKYIAYVKELPLYNRILLIWFTIFGAIPNKIYINNKIHGFFVSFSIFLLLVLSHMFPPLILLYLIFWLLVAESYFFAIAYQSSRSSVFRDFVNKHLFNGDTKFAKDYFAFFWGNMSKGGASSGKFGFVGTLIASAYSHFRRYEMKYVNEQGKSDANNFYHEYNTKPKNVDEYLYTRDRMEERLIDKQTYILKTEKKAHEVGDLIVKWLNENS